MNATRAKRNGRGRWSCAGALLAGAVLAAGLFPAGCVGHNVYPPIEGEPGFTNPNNDPMPQLIIASLRWVVLRYPPNEQVEWNPPAAALPEGDRFAVNLPSGMNREVAFRTVEQIGFGAQAMIPGNEGLPTYHISRIWVSGDEAKVDLLRPVPGLASSGPGRPPVTQGITVRLRGGMQPWRVTSHRVWSMNSMSVPPLNYVPEPPAWRAPGT
jgi:hypothetical protein